MCVPACAGGPRVASDARMHVAVRHQVAIASLVAMQQREVARDTASYICTSNRAHMTPLVATTLPRRGLLVGQVTVSYSQPGCVVPY